MINNVILSYRSVLTNSCLKTTFDAVTLYILMIRRPDMHYHSLIRYEENAFETFPQQMVLTIKCKRYATKYFIPWEKM